MIQWIITMYKITIAINNNTHKKYVALIRGYMFVTRNNYGVEWCLTSPKLYFLQEVLKIYEQKIRSSKNILVMAYINPIDLYHKPYTKLFLITMGWYKAFFIQIDAF